MVWWLAAAVIIMAPLLLHGGVIPWLFALLPGDARLDRCDSGGRCSSVSR